MTDFSELKKEKILEKIHDDELAWVVVGFKGKNYKAAKIMGSGKGGLDEVKAALPEDDVRFGYVRVTAVDVKGVRVSKREKLIFFNWIGPSTPILKKAKAQEAKQAMNDFFRGYHISFDLFDYDDISEELVEKRFRAAGGAHQPDSYHFGVFDENAQANVKAKAKAKRAEKKEEEVSTPPPEPEAGDDSVDRKETSEEPKKEEEAPKAEEVEPKEEAKEEAPKEEAAAEKEEETADKEEETANKEEETADKEEEEPKEEEAASENKEDAPKEEEETEKDEETAKEGEEAEKDEAAGEEADKDEEAAKEGEADKEVEAAGSDKDEE